MELADRQTVQKILKQYQITPRKHWGQNFIVSRTVLSRILKTVNIEPGDTILEIGGGLGTLTLELARRAKRVVVIERDPKLCEVLKNTLKNQKNVKIYCSDARSLTDNDIPKGEYRLIGNLPYGVGTVILRQILETQRPPKDVFVMVQKEVAERICAKPPRMRLLSAAMQYLAEPKILFRIPQRATWPIPEVESALLYLRHRTGARHGLGHAVLERQRFMETVRLGFMHPRKYVLRNLVKDSQRRVLLKERCRIKETSRPQELTLQDWRCIATAL